MYGFSQAVLAVSHSAMYSFHEEKKYSHILFVISGLIAMLIKGPIFLITIAVVIVFKLLDFDISIKKKVIQLSNISIIILVSVFLAIL